MNSKSLEVIMFTVVAIVVLLVLVAGLGELQRRSRSRIARLERSQTIDPATALGTPFALERELGHAATLPCDLSVAEIQLADAGQARDAANALRSICSHGVDQLFCLDLARGSFLLMSYGKLDPDQVADYFESELTVRALAAKIGWAYCRSADPAIRSKVRGAAQAALQRVKGHHGVEVMLVGPEQWQADDLSELVLGSSLRTRREALCLSRKELAHLLNVSDVSLRDIEFGRARPAGLAKRILSVVDTIEESIVRVQRLTDLVAAAAARELQKPSPSPDCDGALPAAEADRTTVAERAIALQRAILAERGAARATVRDEGQATEAAKPGEQPATAEALGLVHRDPDATK